MLKMLLPLVLLLVGAGAGIGAGLFLRPAPEIVAEENAGSVEGEELPQAEEASYEEGDTEGGALAEKEYVRLSNQFVIPIVEGDEVASLVVLSLSVEVELGQQATVFEKEPKLRDSFLQELFNHANRGGFNGRFTDEKNMKVLRTGLLEVAQRDMGSLIKDVLVLEIARQDY